MEITAYVHQTIIGPFRIALRKTGLWHVLWESEDLGSYPSPQVAADSLACGQTRWPITSSPASLGLPEQLSDWDPFALPPR